MSRKTLVVSNVEVYPGYMACDSSAMGEMFCTWFLGYGRGVPLGVFDLDCLAFDDETLFRKDSSAVVGGHSDSFFQAKYSPLLLLPPRFLVASTRLTDCCEVFLSVDDIPW